MRHTRHVTSKQITELKEHGFHDVIVLCVEGEREADQEYNHTRVELYLLEYSTRSVFAPFERVCLVCCPYHTAIDYYRQIWITRCLQLKSIRLSDWYPMCCV